MGSMVPYSSGGVERASTPGTSLAGRLGDRARWGWRPGGRAPFLELDSGAVAAPTWESLPAELRWNLDGADPDHSRVLVTFARRLTVVEQGAREVVSAWRLHSSSVFVVAASRNLVPAGQSYRADGAWEVEHESVGGERFRMKHAELAVEPVSEAAVRESVPVELAELWSALPLPTRALLSNGAAAIATDDYGDRWLDDDGTGARRWLCIERRDDSRLRAAIQSTRVTGPHAVDDGRRNDLPPDTRWDTHAFSAEIGSGLTALLPSPTLELGARRSRGLPRS